MILDTPGERLYKEWCRFAIEFPFHTLPRSVAEIYEEWARVVYKY